MFQLIDEPGLNALPYALVGIGVFLCVFYTVYHFRSHAEIDGAAWLGGWGSGCIFLGVGAFFELPLDRWWWSIVIATVVLLAWFPLRSWTNRLA